MPWGENKSFCFQNHAVSMCERLNGGFITVDEAHYICAILNAPIVEQFIGAGSDARSYKIRPTIYVPTYDPRDIRHQRLSELSQEAHADETRIEEVRAEAETLYLAICANKPKNY